MITYLQLHPNMRWLVGIVLLLALAGTVTWLYLRYVAFSSPLEFDEWQRDPDLPGRDMPTTAGEFHPDPETWDQLPPDEAADLLIAEWHEDLPGPAVEAGRTSHGQAALSGSRAGEPDVWDAWWADLDGLERECLRVRELREREARLWGELVAETRELCGVAA